MTATPRDKTPWRTQARREGWRDGWDAATNSTVDTDTSTSNNGDSTPTSLLQRYPPVGSPRPESHLMPGPSTAQMHDMNTPSDTIPHWVFGAAMNIDSAADDNDRHGPWSLPADPETLRSYLTRYAPMLDRDLGLRAASKRWLPGRPDPDGYLAGDVPAVRSMIAAAIYTVVAHDTAGFERWNPNVTHGVAHQVSLLHALYTAEPHWMPTRVAHAVATSTPPTPQDMATVRFGYPANLVLFGDDVPVDDTVWVSPPYSTDGEEPADDLKVVSAIFPRMARYGGGVCGVVLFSDPDGCPRDDVLWLLTGNPDPGSPYPNDKIRAAAWGWRSRCTPVTRALIDNVAAYLTWGDWDTAPPVSLPPVDDTSWRNAVRTSQFRKREPLGGAAGVRIVAFRPRTPAPTGPPTGTHKSPVTHHRRGHWRNQPVGPEHDRRHEPRWIAPTWVNTDRRTAPTRVWKIEDRIR